MQPHKFYIGSMSPTGGVKKIATCLKQGLLKHGVSPVRFDFLTPAQRALPPAFESGDVVIFCFPVFAGRVPACLTAWPELKGNGAMAFVTSVYGGRACEDAPREMADLLVKHGFKVIGAAELLAQHSLEPRLANGRPDEADKTYIEELAGQLLEAACQADSLPPLRFERSAAYRPYRTNVQPVKLRAENCGHCHLCRKICPVGIIDNQGEPIAEKANLCLGCMACVKHCRRAIRGLPPAAAQAVAQKMNIVYEQNKERKDNQVNFGLYQCS